MTKGSITLYRAKDVIKVRILRWGNNLGYSGWAQNAIACILVRENQREILLYRREEGVWPWRQRWWCGYGTGKTDSLQEEAGMESLLDSPVGGHPCWHLDFSPVKLRLNFWPPQRWENKFQFFSPAKTHWSPMLPVGCPFTSPQPHTFPSPPSCLSQFLTLKGSNRGLEKRKGQENSNLTNTVRNWHFVLWTGGYLRCILSLAILFRRLRDLHFLSCFCW